MSSPYRDLIIARSPSIYLPFDDASGLPQDVSGNGRHITAVAGDETYQVSGPKVGSSAIRCISAGMLRNSAVFTNTINFWFEIWIKYLADPADNRSIFGTGSGIDLINTSGDGFYIVRQGVGFTGSNADTNNLDDGNWHQIGVVVTNASPPTYLYFLDGDEKTNGGTGFMNAHSALTFARDGATFDLAHFSMGLGELVEADYAASYAASMVDASAVRVGGDDYGGIDTYYNGEE